MIKISGPLAGLHAAIKAAEKNLQEAHMDVRSSKLQLGSLMDERTRLLAAGLKPTHQQFDILLREENVVRVELDLAQADYQACELALARAKAALAKWLSNG